jgi:hypothetical protein
MGVTVCGIHNEFMWRPVDAFFKPLPHSRSEDECSLFYEVLYITGLSFVRTGHLPKATTCLESVGHEPY